MLLNYSITMFIGMTYCYGYILHVMDTTIYVIYGHDFSIRKPRHTYYTLYR